MNTRSVKRKASVCNCHKIKQLQKRKARNVVNKANFQGNEIHSAPHKFQTPIFNIHIHLPPFEQNDLKVALPKIQPEIHLHFDKLEWSSESNKKENGNINSEMFNQLITDTLPKFGDIKLYYDNILKKNVTVTGLDRTVHCSSTNYFYNDPDKESCSETESYEKNISGNTNSLNCSNSNTNFTENAKSNNKDSLSSNPYKNFKLKKAVVLLNDVCKTKHYKNMLGVNNSGVGENNNNKCSDKLEEVVNEPECEDMVLVNEELVNSAVKLEMESSECEFLIPYSRSENEVIDVDPLSTVSTKTEMNDSFDTHIINPEGTLTALGEGCNFSEILSRFQVKKKKEFIEDSENNTCKVDNSRVFNENQGDDNIEFSNEIQENQFVEHLNFENENVIEKALDNNQTEALNDLENCVSMIKVEKQLSSPKVTLDSETETVSSKKTSNLLSYNSFQLPSTNELMFEHSYHTTPSRLLELVRKEMSRGRANNIKSVEKLKKEPSQVGTSSTSPMKMQSEETAEKSHKKTQKSSVTQEYIPLEVSGPTKFAVAPLNKVSPYKSHDARNFKAEMLFSNRINRFPSSNYLQTYKLKKKASQNHSKKIKSLNSVKK